VTGNSLTDTADDPLGECLAASVVITTFNRKDTVRAAIESVLSDRTAAEVIVVVDGSLDGTVEMVDEMALADTRIRRVFIENSGEEGARLAGADASRYDVLVFLDDDVIAESNLISGHLQHHMRANHLVVLGYMQTERILSSLWAGNFSIRRADAMVVGMRGAEVFPYHADKAFGLRCKAQGLIGEFDRSLSARHMHVVRPTRVFIADAKRQAEGALLIHRLATDIPFSFADESAFPRPVRRAIRLGASQGLGTAVQSLLRLGMWVAGRVHVFYVEDYLAMVLRLAVQRQTVMALERSLNSISDSARIRLSPK
jgi:glycosyltransferase involved in cell wall biosynthesis